MKTNARYFCLTTSTIPTVLHRPVATWRWPRPGVLAAGLSLILGLHGSPAASAGVIDPGECGVAPPGTLCTDTDGDVCTQAACDGAGNCDQNAIGLSGAPCPDTDDNVCTTAFCLFGGCNQVDLEGPCPDTDGNECTRATCLQGLCIQNFPVLGGACTDTDGDDCTRATCVLGQCEQSVADVDDLDMPCPDTDGNECTSAACGPTGCDQDRIILSTCTDTDGNYCTEARCDTAGVCDQRWPVMLGRFCPDTDGDPCTQASCDGLGTCHQSTPNNDAIGQPCPDTDDNECTTSSCDGFGTCVSSPVDCEDGNACTISIGCDPDFGCQYLEVICADDGNPCTEEFCEPSLGCISRIAADFTPCGESANPCRRLECRSGICLGFSANNGMVCGDAYDACHSIAACAGGDCHSFPDPSTEFLPCGDAADPCDGSHCLSGLCFFFPANDGRPCGETASEPCPTTICIGGFCSSRPSASQGDPCPDVDGNGCTQAQCDNLGNCDQSVPSNYNDSCPDEDGNACSEALCDDQGQCVQEAIVHTLTFSLDIKPGSCPNALDIRARGVIPMSLLGAADFDVTTVDVSSLLLVRTDGVGGAVAPTSWVFQDTGTPFSGSLCACHRRGGDGTMDLSLRFDTQAVVKALQLSTVALNASVQLIVTGTQSDGCDFIAGDCMVRVPVKGR